jgi:hypothetical protein
MLDTNLDNSVKEAIESGRFPLCRPNRQWGGRGGGAQCSICRGRIGADALELELEFDASGAVTSHHVHVACYGAWERFLQARSLAESTRLDDRKLYPGDYYRAEPDTTDRRVWSDTGCTCVLIASGHDVLR